MEISGRTHPTRPDVSVATEESPVDIAAMVRAEQRPQARDKPWLMVNMITSLDGAVTREGRSTTLGGPADRRHFIALRELADVILVGASTARIEKYHLPQMSSAAQERRKARGQRPAPRLAVVSRSLRFDPAPPFLLEAGADPPDQIPVVLTAGDAPHEKVAAIAPVAHVVTAGTNRVDPSRALKELALLDANVIVCEGGPSLLADFARASLVDEWFITIAPLVIGGDATRMVTGPELSEPQMNLARVLAVDGFLLTRYLSGPVTTA